ncbi:uncharacterized protein LOC110095864 [Dendrobium catenatum]|uniref:Uncharacterized protein n=1 Tax=Dendrobium catenatum TaxID=906689 RepID=A0A2I0VE16_9ASPA|nr:uncharacterized protein LOC110095864 [Dendrobium catenatum]PKU61659.1 hypothetical protein MA16_Dca029013 [Dendrobium catenatum]
MGNCQAAETAMPAAEIEHPDGKHERIYRSIRVSHVMSTNPGYYVAVVTCSGGAETAVKYATLLQPDDNLHIGQAYRLVSFEEVLREFCSKKRVRLSRLIQRQKEREERKTSEGGADEVGNSSPEMVKLVVSHKVENCAMKILAFFSF